MKYLVVNASPIILLGKIGRLGLLTIKGFITMTPDKVVQEVMIKQTPESLALENALHSWMKTFDNVSGVQTISSIIGEDVSRGEVDVIAKARQLLDEGHEVLAVLDDRSARKGAQALSIPITGTLGMVVHAVRSGNISSDDGIAVVNKLLSIGARFDYSLIKEIMETLRS
ncbi:MAG: hypothetical protein IBX40_07675 [Methanosarcinales archaeon]|nr:hypothetical protein [Methanosarcinales archaeon]